MQYRFDDYALDVTRRELRRGTELIAVEPQVFDLLDHLIRYRDRVVSKDDLIATVWNGRIVSESALTSRINSARTAVGDTGEEQRLIKTLRSKGFRFVGVVSEEQGVPAAAVPTEHAVAPLALADQPSIAVLPFVNISGDPAQDYFADGMTEEIITALARFKSLFVIARNSSFAYRGQTTDIERIARELGVRYVLQGSVRNSGDRVRITGQLIVAETGTHIWANRFERRIGDIFDLQDEITESIVGAVEPEILSAEMRRARSKRPDSLVAYDCVLRAYQHLFNLTLEDNDKALDFLQRAIRLEPDYALAYAYASWANLFRVQLIQGGSLRPLLTNALTLAQRAVELEPTDPLVQTIRGAWQLMIERDFEGGVARHEEAFEKNPNSVWICGCNGFGHALCRNPQRALTMLDRARRLSPRDSSMFLWLPGGAIAHLTGGRPEQAIQWTEDALRLNPRHLISLFLRAAAEMTAGRDSAGRRSVERMRAINPGLDIKFASKMLPFKFGGDRELILSALRAAGLPD
ncbi:MAG: winged helix-turn-helix domain-containing tetratricopeptide repeat protein [Xanthobacteraceae bacterium]